VEKNGKTRPNPRFLRIVNYFFLTWDYYLHFIMFSFIVVLTEAMSERLIWECFFKVDVCEKSFSFYLRRESAV